MLIRFRLLHQRGGMDSCLSRKRALAHIRRMPVRRTVQHLIQHPACMRQGTQPLGRDLRRKPLGEFGFEQERRDHRREVGIPAALADAVERALDLTAPAAHRHQRVGDRVLGIVVGMNAQMAARHDGRDIGDNPLDLMGQRPAVGIAQHNPACASVIGRFGHGQRIGSVGLVAVEKVLAVHHRFAATSHDGPHRLIDALEVFLVGDPERDPHMIVPRLGNETDRARLRGQNRLQARIVLDRPARPLDHAERGERRRREVRLAVEKLAIGRICARKPALDVVDAKIVEHARDPALVGQRKIDARRLRAVAQGRVEQIEPFFGHDTALAALAFNCFVIVVLDNHSSSISTRLRLVAA